jgi:TonB-dependent receptor
MNRRHVARTVALSVLLSTTALSTAALAQAASPDQTTVDELVVTGQRFSQQQSIRAKRDAKGVSDVIAADEMGRLPDKNAAESLERLPGVGIKYDQGEGRYVSIRGVDGALNNVTVNGVEIGSPDSDTRAIPLDVVSGQLASRIEVVKAVTPDMDAQAIGGTVNFVTQSPFDFRKDLVAAGSFQAGSQDLNDKTPIGADATVGGVFGPEGSFGFLLGANYSSRDYRTYGVYPDDWRPVTGTERGLPTNIKYTTYDLERERIGLSGSLEFRPGDADRLYLRGVYSKFTEDEYRQRYRLDFATDSQLGAGTVTLNPDGTGVSTGNERRQDLRLEQKDKTISVVSAGGEHERGDWTLAWDASYVSNELDEPNAVWQFRGGSLTTDFDMRPLLYTATARVEAAPSALGFRQVTLQENFGEETIGSLKADATRKLGFGEDSILKFGFKYRDTEKSQDNNNDVYTRAGSGPFRFTLADFDLQGADTRTLLDGRTYYNSPTIDAAEMQRFTRDNIDQPYFVLDTASSLSNAVLGDYEVQERITAGYAMADLDFGMTSILAGFRVEHTRTDVTGYRLVNGSTVERVSSSGEYTDVLPGVHVKLEASDNLLVRIALTQTIGRPQYPQLSPGGGLSYVETAPGVFEGDFSEGNVDLKPYKSTNIDISGEWYFAQGGLLSIGAFHKAISDPIFGYSEVQENVTVEGRLYDRFEYSQPRNGESGRIAGIEFGYRQQFTMLPGAFSGLGLSATATFSNSKLKVPGRGSLPFPKQSDEIYGLQVFYQKYGVEASLNWHSTSDYQDTIGDDALSDTFFSRFERVDFKVSYAVTPQIKVFAIGQNLNDEVLWEYMGGRRDWFVGYERYGPTYYLGLSANW